jgi:hypothetical protein
MFNENCVFGYFDVSTGDIQTAALILGHISPRKVKDTEQIRHSMNFVDNLSCISLLFKVIVICWIVGNCGRREHALMLHVDHSLI